MNEELIKLFYVHQNDRVLRLVYPEYAVYGRVDTIYETSTYIEEEGDYADDAYHACAFKIHSVNGAGKIPSGLKEGALLEISHYNAPLEMYTEAGEQIWPLEIV